MNFLTVYIIAVAKLRLVFMRQRFVRISFGSSVLKTLDFGSEGVGCRFPVRSSRHCKIKHEIIVYIFY